MTYLTSKHQNIKETTREAQGLATTEIRSSIAYSYQVTKHQFQLIHKTRNSQRGLVFSLMVGIFQLLLQTLGQSRTFVASTTSRMSKKLILNHLGGDPMVRAWDQEVCSLCGLRFEPCGCSYDGHWRLKWSLTPGSVGLVEVRASWPRTPTLN